MNVESERNTLRLGDIAYFILLHSTELRHQSVVRECALNKLFLRDESIRSSTDANEDQDSDAEMEQCFMRVDWWNVGSPDGVQLFFLVKLR